MNDITFEKEEKVLYNKNNTLMIAIIREIHYDDTVPYYTIYIPSTKVEKQTTKNHIFKLNNLYGASYKQF